MEKYLYKFYWDCGRQGSLEGLFVATEMEVERMIGSHAYFGEVLGKHSEVYGNIEEGDIYKLDVSSHDVEEVSKILGESWSGFDPREFVHTMCDECEDSMSPEDWNCEYREDLEYTLCDECYENMKVNLEEN